MVPVKPVACSLLRSLRATNAATATTSAIVRPVVSRGDKRTISTGAAINDETVSIHTGTLPVHTGTTGTAKDTPLKNQLCCWLDLRGTGLSILERLVLEEYIWKHDDQNWVICGSHTPRPHRFLRVPTPATVRAVANTSNATFDTSWNIDETNPNDSVSIILGIGGKPDLLLNVEAVRKDRVSTLRRFSGGGTVVLDHQSLWTTMIGRRPSQNNNNTGLVTELGPRSILKYTADTLYGPMFTKLAALQTLKRDTRPESRNRTFVLDAKSCGFENSGRVITVPNDATNVSTNVSTASNMDSSNSSFALLENDFVWGQRKIGGNAQSIGQTGWLQHTSFLWDYEPANMAYLTMPAKRPDYRGDRTHADFLSKLRDIFPSLTQTDVVHALAETCHDRFHVKHVHLPEIVSMFHNSHGGMQAWFETKCRTKIVTHTL